MDGKSNPPQLEALSYPWNVPVIVIYSLTAFVSLCSNLITVVILLKGEHLSTELWKFLLNLCIADIIMSIFCTEFTYTSYMLGRWIFPQWSCALISCIQCTSVTVSIYSLGVIGLDRYVRYFAILYPFHPVPWLRANKVCLIVFIWVIGIAISSPLYANMAVEPFWINDTQYFECIETWSDTSARLYTVFLFLFTFLIPIVALTFVYSRICLHMWRNTTAPGNPDQARDRVIIDRRLKVIKMLVTIVVMFFICWAPTHVFQLLVNFNFFNIQNQPQTFGYYTYVTSYFFIHWLSQAHCLVNPFVYCFMSDNFRQSIRGTLAKCFRSRRDEAAENDMRELNTTQVQSVTMMATTVQMTTTTSTTGLPRATDHNNANNIANNNNNNNNNNNGSSSMRMIHDSSLNGKQQHGSLGDAAVFGEVAFGGTLNRGQQQHQQQYHQNSTSLSNGSSSICSGLYCGTQTAATVTTADSLQIDDDDYV